MTTKRKRVLIFTADEGHLSLAKAAATTLQEEYRVKIVNLFGQEVFFTLYRFLYRFFPVGMKIPFYLAKFRQSYQLLEKHISQLKRKEIKEEIISYQPDLVITTYFGYLPSLNKLKKSFNFKFINLVSDPVSIHPFLFSPAADYNLVFDKQGVQIGQEIGLKQKQIKAIGWLTQPKFYQPLDSDIIRKQLGFKNSLTFLICGGSEGTTAILNTLPTLLFSQHQPLQLIFVSGTNNHLRQVIKQSIKLAKKLGFKQKKILNLGFTQKMAEYITISDVVIGKAGPNLLFETVARKKPFIAINHISGQESGNIELIKRYQLGWVAENPLTFHRLMKRIFHQPQLLETNKRSISLLYQKNKRAITAFRNLCRGLLK